MWNHPNIDFLHYFLAYSSQNECRHYLEGKILNHEAESPSSLLEVALAAALTIDGPQNGELNRDWGMRNSNTFRPAGSAGCCHALQRSQTVVLLHDGTRSGARHAEHSRTASASHSLPMTGSFINLAAPSLTAHPRLANLAMAPPNMAMSPLDFAMPPVLPR